VLRNLSYVLFGTMAALLLVATLGVLVVGLGECLAGGRTIRLVAFDTVMPVGALRTRVGFAIQDADRDAPLAPPFLLTKFPDGWTELAWVSSKGLGASEHTGQLAPGAASYEVHFGDTDPRMEVCARGTIWVGPQDEATVWVDAAALLKPAPAEDVAEATSFPSAREAADVLKGLAQSHRVVYLVPFQVRDYGAVRYQLAAAGYPPGPALWVQPGQEAGFLNAARHNWRQVTAALVCTPTVAQAAKQMRIRTLGVPSARTAPAEEAGPPGTWSEAAEALASK
jgi:hypothetical protein